MFRPPCAIIREQVCAFWDRYQDRTQRNANCWVPLEFYQLCPVLIRISEGAYVLPDDDTRRPKHVGAIDGWQINIINKIGAFVGLFYMYDRMYGARIKLKNIIITFTLSWKKMWKLTSIDESYLCSWVNLGTHWQIGHSNEETKERCYCGRTLKLVLRTYL
jgi:hypothetical protein